MNPPAWIATRRLTDPDGGPDLEVRLGIPALVAPDFWECPFALVEGEKQVVSHTGAGVDAFQALVQAQEGIRAALVKTGRKLCWLDGEPGFTGFTRTVPISFGLGLVLHLEAIVEHEVDRYALEAAAGEHGRPFENS